MKQSTKMSSIFALLRRCNTSDSNFIYVILRALYYRLLYKKHFLLHQKVTIKGVKNIHAPNLIQIGIGYVGFQQKTDKTYLNVNGKLNINGDYSIGRGCRFDIGKDGVVEIGMGGYVNVNTIFVIMNNLSIGDNCAISFDCLFMDEDFHNIEYQGKKTYDHSISIGNHVWIGNGVKIYKGTVIPNGCVVASNSIVKGRFERENTLIAGHPARVIKEGVYWK